MQIIEACKVCAHATLIILQTKQACDGAQTTKTVSVFKLSMTNIYLQPK